MTLTHIAATITANVIIVFAQFITAARAIWRDSEPTREQRIYFVNHASHGDFILVWTVLPAPLRKLTRPVAGADYWLKTRLKSFIGRTVFNAVLIDRRPESRSADPVSTMADALDAGSSLILFPEGTRNTGDEKLLPFKSGIYHLAKARPDIDLVPVWIENLNRVMPKGEIVPIPLICRVLFGAPIRLEASETKDDFIHRARSALLALSPAEETSVEDTTTS
ncbi:MAG: 1-acyl-sn-glycerol-3-phosphate acyltransferase [Gammaproteobacteria bacterium]|nr:1-acyl-sn-glycerol-3-phosphate acyltransferase [Gammaproteobacteria bacterium]